MKNGAVITVPFFIFYWEQRKLGDVGKFSKGRGYSKNDILEEGIPIVLYGSLYTDYQTLIKEVNTFVEDKGNSVYSLGNEVIVPSSGESAEDIARASAVGNKGIILGGDLNIIYPNKNIDPIFLALLISSGERKIELAKKAQGKSVVHLYNTDLKELNLIYPSKEEQGKISILFSHLDNLITLHQRMLFMTNGRDSYEDNKRRRFIFTILRTMGKSLQRRGSKRSYNGKI